MSPRVNGSPAILWSRSYSESIAGGNWDDAEKESPKTHEAAQAGRD